MGVPNQVYDQDAWYSNDGSTWTEATASPGFGGRSGAKGVVCGNAMWFMGGSNPGGNQKDVWVSTNGVNWAETNISTPFSVINSALSFGGNVWALGSPASGNNWTLETGCCQVPTPTSTFTPTPGGPGALFAAEGLTIIGEPSFTPTPIPTDTVTPSPTPTAIPEDLVSVLAIPNISTDGEPIRFQVELGQEARIELILYNVSGEKVYETKTTGTVGLNSLLWNLNNGTRADVASGLYLYAIEVSNRSFDYHKTGKVIVLH